MAHDILKLVCTVVVEIPLTESQVNYAKTQYKDDYEDEYSELFRECLYFGDNVNVIDYWCDANMPADFFK